MAVVSAVPRLVVVAHERADVVLPRALIDKNVFFAETFVHSGTFGYTPGVPSADTQPLYGFFLIPLYWLFNGSWWSIALAQTALAAATAIVVYEIARRLFTPSWALVGAFAATLNPYLVWHDVHVAREVLDGFLAAALVLVALLVVERGSLVLAAALGGIAGLAILANVRLALLPLVLAGYLLWAGGANRHVLTAATAVLAVSVLVISPWLARNRIEVGCLTLTTNSQALWRANNVNTDRVLAAGGWIDDVPLLPAPPVYKEDGGRRHLDECAAMRFYRHKVLEFWRNHPGEKGRLAGRAVVMLWDPRARTYDVKTTSGASARPVGRLVDVARTWGQGLFMVSIYALAIVGAVRIRKSFVVLSLSLLVYQTVVAMVFAGTTRYRSPWDFLLALLATGGLCVLAGRLREGRTLVPTWRGLRPPA